MKTQAAAVIIALILVIGVYESINVYAKALTAEACVKSGGSWLLKWNNIGYCVQKDCK